MDDSTLGTNEETAEDFPIADVSFDLDGRIFVVAADTTFEQDQYLAAAVIEAGLDKLPEMKTEDPDFDLSGVAKEMLVRAYNSGRLFDLMAGVLIEKDTYWNLSNAKANAEFFRSVKKQKSKQTLQANLIFIILNFFVRGANSDKIFQKYSELRANELAASRHGVSVQGRSGETPN